MRRCGLAALLAALLLGLSGCGETQVAEGVRLWFPVVQSGSQPPAAALSWELYETNTQTTDVTTVMRVLLNGPTGEGLEDPFPADTRLLGYTLSADGLLQLDLSAPYGDLTGIDLTLADYCITLTMCQLEGVEQVSITVNGNEIAYRARQILSPDDVMFAGAEEEPKQVSVVLYFARSTGGGLGFENRELTLTESDNLYEVVLEALMAGPESGSLVALFPEACELLDARLDDGICYVNFSAAFQENAPESQEAQRLLLYSVVNTLGNLDAVTAVQLLVEDTPLDQFGGVATDRPLEPDFSLASGQG